jgi:hypothetical protein
MDQLIYQRPTYINTNYLHTEAMLDTLKSHKIVRESMEITLE